ncbi:aminopeptidase P family protein [Candidatus Aquiluna sp. UB-MaderosW2red]|uniref:aminopeptidase P family protein n=1 Tax=Candidatus Aquiluna sp. UB-MaderosW2red TaxID=1855377 RepID=UPI000875C0DB|nr:aminopeptidase P family protein [Candidatus Aquiluna sp. UB-MaderosW2red]SCX14094.1 Xaa-Pro aminopeptidase [Candidatus Aquiluna sp. UB-MaderosW2red]
MGKKINATNRSRTPHSKEFLDFIASDWQEQIPQTQKVWEVASYAKLRRDAIAKKLAGKVLVIEAGEPKTRSNDTEYRYRAHTAFSYLTGWGSEAVPGSILVIDARTQTPSSTLYFLPTAGRQTDEFFANPAIGEFWVGARPGLQEVSEILDIQTASIHDFKKKIKELGKHLNLDSKKLLVAASTMRFVKDDYEISQMREAVDVTIQGFGDIARSLPKAAVSARGERVVETAFYARARQDGYELGYDTIAAAGPNACTLHWTRNDGEVNNGDLILVDAGVELNSLYTADITRTIPINGKFTQAQKRVYDAVLEASDAAFAAARPGVKFRDIHNAAMEVISRKAAEFGLLPVTAEESLLPENQHHRRFMVHGTSHHLGMDVHDCAQAKREHYQDGILEPGMIFTIEPGLYFHKNDLLVPEEMRGIGVRIEDDVLVTDEGVENLSGALPRTTEGIEAWYSKALLGG